ncbi:nucleotide pyrophosphohydrolase [Candidatus Woesearchaeota archaeon]|nr:nucleotide pyrophosphohydrolase [Candidatus Woesearchaeota archaeon]
MKEKFQELYENLQLDRNNSSWSKEVSLMHRFEELESEIAEVREALEKEDYNNLKDELGDTLWDLLSMIIIAEEKGLFNGKEVIGGAIEKLKRRKPHIFEGKKLSKEEESKMWLEIKKREKAGEYNE